MALLRLPPGQDILGVPVFPAYSSRQLEIPSSTTLKCGVTYDCRRPGKTGTPRMSRPDGSHRLRRRCILVLLKIVFQAGANYRPGRLARPGCPGLTAVISNATSCQTRRLLLTLTLTHLTLRGAAAGPLGPHFSVVDDSISSTFQAGTNYRPGRLARPGCLGLTAVISNATSFQTRRLLLTLTLTHLTLRGSAAGPLGAFRLVVEVLAQSVISTTTEF